MTAQHASSSRAGRITAPPPIPALPRWLPYILFVVTTLIFFHSQIVGDTFFWEDFVEYIYPVQTFAARHLSEGTVPFWNPYTFNGMPFLADAQVGFFYPGNMLLSLFISEGRLPVLALELVVILHFVLAQSGMYLLARHWGISSIGATLAAVSYGFSGMMVCHVFHPMMVYHLAWLPLILLHFDRGLNEHRLKHALFSGLLFGLVMLAGHPQSTLYIAFLLLLLALWHVLNLFLSRTADGRGIAFAAVFAAVPVAVAAGLFLVQYLPSAELATLSERSEITYEKATEGSLVMSQFATAVVPRLFGVSTMENPDVPFYLEGGQYYYYWETAFYFGVTALLLGLIGAVAMIRTRVGGFLVLAAVVGALFALGSNGILYDVFYRLPLFGSFRLPGRMLFYVILAGTVLAGFGFDALARHTRSVSFRTLAIAAGIPLLIALGVVAGVIPSMIGTPETFLQNVGSYGTQALVLTLVASGLVFLLYRGMLTALPAGLMLVLLAFIDLYMAGADFNRSTRNPEEVFRIDPALRQSLTAQHPDSLFRVKMREGGYMAMARNQGMVDDIMLYEGYNPLLLARRVPPAPSIAASFDLLNIRYDIALDQATGSAGFVERTSQYPRARMVYRAVTTTPDKSADIMRSGGVEFAGTAVLEQASPLALPNKTPQEVQHSVRCTQYTDNALTYEISTAENGILSLSEIWYPAWQVTIDGRPADLLRINYSLRGVAVPAGTHTVTLEYRSGAFVTGGILSLGTLLLTSGLLVWLQLRDNRRSRTPLAGAAA